MNCKSNKQDENDEKETTRVAGRKPNGKAQMKAVYASLAGLFVATIPASAQMWTEMSTNTEYDWYGVASSADGSKLAATVASAVPTSGEGIYLSTNSGATWTQSQAPSGAWGPIASSADGTKLAAANANGYIYTSTNSGGAWIQRATPNEKWLSLASSADGSKLIAADNPGFLIVSTNSGVGWLTPTNLNRYWLSVVCSADGNKMAAQYAGDDADPWVSTNCGMTWQPAAIPINQGGNLAMTATGNMLVLLSRGLFYLSTNWGLSWSSLGTQIPGYATMVSSADGSTMLTFGGGIGQEQYPATLWVSTNSGVNWTPGGPTNMTWSALASSADGRELAAVSEYGGVWISQTPPSPQLNLSFSGNNLNFSWIVPSTNMLLEQSFDLVNWTLLTNTLSLDLTNLQDELTLSPTNGAGFFRLEQ
jgi:hypothetical protein